MRPPRTARTTGVFAWAARGTRQDRLLDGVPGSERGSVALGVTVVALTTRFHPSYHGTSHGGSTWTFLIIFVVLIVIAIAVGRFVRRRRN